MINRINLLTQEEKDMLLYKFETNGGSEAGLQSVLEHWNRSKNDNEFFNHYFGNELIKEYPVELKTNENILAEQFDTLLRTEGVFKTVLDDLLDLVDSMPTVGDYTPNEIIEYEGFYQQNKREIICALLRNTGNMVNNTCSQEIKFLLNNKLYKINKGQKYTKAVRAIANAFGYEKPQLIEQFIIEHSKVLNNKSIKGTLCLSIHPMDYITLSDNSNRWTSCLSWDEEGCHQAGVIEMITSPTALVAYLKSDNTVYEFGNYQWNSKKWRELFMVDQHYIICNKQYPFSIIESQNKVLSIIKPFVEEVFGEYSEKMTFTEYRGILGDYPTLITNHMYDDTHGKTKVCYNKKITENYLMKFSGNSVCIRCGKQEIFTSESLLCSDCGDFGMCDHCGDYISEDESSYITVNGEIICEYCFDTSYNHCSECYEIFRDEDLLCIEYQNGLRAAVCPNCHASF